MKRERPIRLPEPLRLSPKLQGSPIIRSVYFNDLFEDVNTLHIIAVALLSVVVTFLVARHRRNAQASSPDVPWVYRKPKKWFSKLRARTWTTLHYEAALKEAYDVVRQ